MTIRYLRYFIIALLVLSSLRSEAKTLILKGSLESRIRTTQQINFDAPQRVETFTFRFALPVSFSNKAVTQEIEALSVKFSPEPVSAKTETDAYGNKFIRANWKALSGKATVRVSFTATIRSSLTPMESTATFPISEVPTAEAVYLKPTRLVQSNSEEISSLARKLTSGAKTEHEAVQAILNWVADNVKYTYNPPEYDAIYTLRSGRGNCQNFAHLSMALLRASGIPARIVGGISLKRQWKIPVGGESYLVQDMGQGGHAWLEIYFPDLGWLSYDPQQSRQFTSTRHIKQTHGLDSTDINDKWSASPYLPEYSESIEADFETDNQSMSLAKTEETPRPYVVSNNLVVKPALPKKLEPEAVSKTPPQTEKPTEIPTSAVEPPPVVTPPVTTVTPEPEKLKRKGMVEFGNTEFPALVDVYHAIGNEAVRILDKETAEYVTSRHVYAQAFQTGDDMALETVSLAVRKFGGDGTLYVDVVKDDGGKPGLSGLRSLPVYLTEIKHKPGYYWVDFKFPEGSDIQAGRHWIVLRHSGEAIVNWFYIPGNVYGDGDDTRSTLKGYKWEDILNYDFVFRVKGNIK